MGLHEIEKLCTTKEMVSKLRGHPQNGRKSLLAMHQVRDNQNKDNQNIQGAQKTNRHPLKSMTQ
jgi:hypothetical protein